VKGECNRCHVARRAGQTQKVNKENYFLFLVLYIYIYIYIYIYCLYFLEKRNLKFGVSRR